MSKILVKSQRDGFRRAGIEFNKAGVEIDADTLTEEQAAAIDAEPMLSVSAVAEGAEAKAPAAPAPVVKVSASKKGGKK